MFLFEVFSSISDINQSNLNVIVKTVGLCIGFTECLLTQYCGKNHALLSWHQPIGSFVSDWGLLILLLYETRNEFWQIPLIAHRYEENCLRYQLPCILNCIISQITDKVHTHSEFRFSLYVKNYFINNYSEECEIFSCHVCGRSSY